MLKEILKQAISTFSPITTYSTGLLQVKAFKILKEVTTDALKKYDINSLDWAFLGLLYSNPAGFKLADVAEMLGIEASFMTLVIDGLEKRQLVKRTVDIDDKRYKVVKLTETGKELVPKVETYLRGETRYLRHGLGVKKLFIYSLVLKKIVDNYYEHEAQQKGPRKRGPLSLKC